MRKFNCLASIISILLLSPINITLAQDCTFYFPNKQGAEIEMKSFDDNDKLISTNVNKVLEVIDNTIKVQTEVFDKKQKPLTKSTFKVSCKDGEFVVDMSSYLKGVNMDAYKDMEMKIETEDMHLPSSLKPGDKLDDGQMTIKVSNQGFPIMTMVVKVYNRRVEAIENVTTPAGTYECAKITYNIDSKTIFSISVKGVEWVAKNVGVVKSESYNPKGKLEGYMLLTSLK